MRSPILALVPASTALVLAACEPMEPSDNPLAPVAVEAPSAGGFQPDPAFDFEPVVLHSEDLAPGARAGAPAPAPGAAEAGSGGPGAAEAGSGAAPSAAAPAAPAPASQAVRVPVLSALPAGASATAAWPVRLLTTLDDTQPPRAILGLADGREVVVKPGTMLPDQGIVVMSVGRGQVQIARIAAEGDHATVRDQTLTAQYGG